jgi:hypothetical protein
MQRPAEIRRAGTRRPSKAPLAVMVVGIAVLFGAAWLGMRQYDGAKQGREGTASAPVPAAAAEVASAPVPQGPARLIDGVFAAVPEPPAESPYLAVIIDNHTEARPASGLNAASVVYEAPAEAGITRLLAIYPSGAGVAQVGPVRSVRPYFIDWASEYGALLAHVGGSPEALARLKADSDPVTDLNEFWNGANFWRATDRSAPHNAYTSSALLEKAAARKDATAKQLASWRFKDDAPAADRPTEAVLRIGSKARGYEVQWRYQPAGNAFERLQGGVLQRDGGQAVMARNIVVVLTKVTVLDDVGRRRIQTTGEGSAVFALDGQTYRGTWRKSGVAARTRFYDASGTELRLNRGVTWIEVVPDNTEVQ